MIFKSFFIALTFTALGGFGGSGVLTLAGNGATLGVGVGAYELRGATGATLGVGETLDGGEGGVGAEKLTQVEISEVLALSQVGDQIIINPTEKIDFKAKRIINVLL